MTARAVHRLLRPLRARQRAWAAGDLDDVPEDPAQVRAQQLVVRVERADPPGRTPVLQAAAAASLAVLADPRADEDGEWHEECAGWLAGRIRKVARRARGVQWATAADLPGVTVACAGAEVRAYPPGLVSEVPKEISRLQVSGTDLSDVDDPGPAPAGGPVLWLSPTVAMTAGKAMAQVGHAAMLLATYLDETVLQGWLDADLPVAVRTATDTQWTGFARGPLDPEQLWTRTATVRVRDAGFTEVDPGTVTVVAQWTAQE